MILTMNFIKQYKTQLLFYILFPLLTLTFGFAYFSNQRNIERAYGATSVVMPTQGGTGTSTIPTYGQILVGQANGKYAPTSTLATTTINGLLTGLDGANFSGTVSSSALISNGITLITGQVLTAGSFTNSTTMDFKAGNNTGANAFRIQFYESLVSGIKNSGGYIQYNSVGNYLEFGGMANTTGVDVPGFRIDRDSGKVTFVGESQFDGNAKFVGKVDLTSSTQVGNYTQDTNITIAGKTNSAGASRLNLWEQSNGNGGYIKLDGGANKFYIGTNNSTTTDTNAIEIIRGSAVVSFLGNIKSQYSSTIYTELSTNSGGNFFINASGGSVNMNTIAKNNAFNIYDNTSATSDYVKLRGNEIGLVNSSTQVIKFGNDVSYIKNGNLGIGTTTPTNLLSIEKKSANGEFIGSEILESGKGVGLKTGVWKQGAGAYDLAGIWASPSKPSNLNYIFGTTGATSDTYFNAPSGKGMYFQNNGTSLMTMLSTGFLGIGTTTPRSKLHVTGTGTTTAWIGNFGSAGQICLGTASTTVSVCFYGDPTTGNIVSFVTSTY